jgi:signal transduction histidine kinase
MAHIQVADTGSGMTDDESAHAFDRFWRAQDARDVPGFGLGLPLVRQIVAAHRGKASITSALGSGTTVTLALPEYQP